MPPVRPAFVTALAKVPRIGRHVTKAHDRWLRHQIHERWDVRNAHAARLFRDRPTNLGSPQRTFIDELQASGLSVGEVGGLFGEDTLWADLQSLVTQWLDTKKVKNQEAAYYESAGRRQNKWKEYILMMNSFQGAVLSWNNPLLKMGVSAPMLDVANGYFGMFTRLLQADVWKTLPSREATGLTGSRRWHRDPEDVKVLKIFIYLTDVGAEAGPLHYVRRSRRGDQYGDLWPQDVPYGSVTPDQAVETTVPASEWHVCAHPAGTVIGVDTAGLHMGGRATQGERLMAVWTFVSESSPWARTFEINRASLPTALSAAAKFALSQPV